MNPSREPRADPSLRAHDDDLAATLAARRELGPESEEEVIQRFLQRVERAVDARAEEVSRSVAKRQASRTGAIAASIGLSIPLVAIVDETTGVLGVAFVCAMVIAVNLIDVLRDSGKR